MGHATRGILNGSQGSRDAQLRHDRWTGLVVVLVVVALALLLVAVEVLGGPSSMQWGRYWPLLP